jgi:hypothetical protein
MPFRVIYRTSDGSSCHEQADAIDEAALFVERLRNKEGIDEIRIYRMEEISFAFRPYYKVELGMVELQNTTAPPSSSTATVVEDPAPPADAEAAADGPVEVESPPAESDVAADAEPKAVTDVRTDSTLPPPPPPGADGEPAGANGRRGLFGR